MPQQIQIARSQMIPLTLLLLDVDYLKVINTEYGGAVGDQVLQLLSQHLQENLLDSGNLFRSGGDEFVLIFGGVNPQEVLKIAHHLQHSVSHHAFVVEDTASVNIKVNIGLATLQPADDLEGLSLLKRAEADLRQKR